MIEVTYNVLDPAQMTEHERHQEVARILAIGVIRLCHRASEEVTPKQQIPLAMSGDKSVHTSAPNAVLRAATLLRNRNANPKHPTPPSITLPQRAGANRRPAQPDLQGTQ